MPSRERIGKLLSKELLASTYVRILTLTSVVTGIWYMGYSQRSFSWLIIPVVAYVWHDKMTTERTNKSMLGQELAKNEKNLILARMDELPAWVNFPDIERVDWLNRIMDQIWPYIGEYVETLLKTTVETSVRESLPSSLKSFKFARVDLGDVPPLITGIKVYNQRRPGEIYMDLELNYSSDINIKISIKGIGVGIKDFRIQGMLRVVLKPLINRPPFLGGALVFFLNNPEIDFDLTNLGNALDIPGLNDLLKSAIVDTIANMMVLPNRLPVQIAPHLDLRRLKFPRPQGVVRIVIKGAKDLVGKDISFKGKKSSDPYASVTIGTQTFKTKHVNKNLNPEWNEAFELVVDSADGQLLFLEVFDHDKAGKDDSLGKVTMDLTAIAEHGTQDEILPLEHVQSGQIILHLDWFWLSPDRSELDRILKIVEQNTTSKQSTAILIVFLYSAKSLPMVTAEPISKYSPKNLLCSNNKKVPHQPSPQAILSVGQQVKHSVVKQETSDPCWEQGFRFMVTNPNHQTLNIDVIDDKTKKNIGTLACKIKELLSAPDFIKDEKFVIKSSDPGSHFMLRLCLRILTPDESSTDWHKEEQFAELDGFEDDVASGDVDHEKKVKPPTPKPETPPPPEEPEKPEWVLAEEKNRKAAQINAETSTSKKASTRKPAN